MARYACVRRQPKRGFCNDGAEAHRMRIQALVEEEEAYDSRYRSTDVLSELPPPVLHHILCFLSQKEAFQTRALAKSWRFHGPTRPKFDFRESDFGGNQHRFIAVMENTIDRCLNRRLSLLEFSLEMNDNNYLSTKFLDLWIPLIVHTMAVKIFNLSIVARRVTCFDLPQRLFVSDSIENMSLQNCKLSKNLIRRAKLERLKSFSLKGGCIENETVEIVLSGCPLIESLVLFECYGLTNIVVDDKYPNLKHFHFCNWVMNKNVEHVNVEISIETIETIKIERCSNWFHRHHRGDGNQSFPLLHSLHLDNVLLSPEAFDCLSCHFPGLENLTLAECYGFGKYQFSNRCIKHLRIEGMSIFQKGAIDDGDHLFPLVESLYMDNVKLSSELFDCLSCHFPSLQRLTLVNCNGRKKYQLSSRSIKHLRIEGTNISSKVLIDAPNLVVFQCEGGVPKSISFKKTSAELKSKVVVRSDVNYRYDVSSWCLELYESLKGFVGSQIYLDIISNFKGIHKRVKDCHPSLVAAQDNCEPIVVERLSMQLTRHSTSSSSVLITNVFRVCHPRNMTQFMYSSPRGVEATGHNQLTEYLQKVLLSERVMRQCYSWKQDLEEARMERVSEDAERNKVQFRLKWKE